MRHQGCASTMAGALLIALTGTAAANDADNADLARRLAELEARDATNTEMIAGLRSEVASLRAQTGEDWLDEQRSEEVRALVQETLADADTRASLLQGGMSAGWDNGFFIASPDGNFRLQFGATIQVRFVYNHQDDGVIDEDRWGFENRRTRLRFKGNIVDPSWMYFIQGDFGLHGTFSLLDAWIDKDLGNGWTFRAGKFMLPFSRESLVSHSKPLAVERTLITNYFSPGRSQGIELMYSAEQWKIMAAYSDGGLGNLSGVTAPALAYDTEYAFTARGEWLAAGDWKQFGDWTSFEGEEFGFLLGGAIHWQSAEYGESAMGPELEVFRWTLDASAEFGGANLAGSVYGNHTDANSDAIADVDQYGLMVQGGFFVTEGWELFGRYEWADEDAEGVDDLSVATIGFNRYFSGQNLKWSTDLSYAFNEVTGTFASDGLGFRADAAGNDGQFVLRTQLQLMF
jgi:hypothetical protein